MASLREANKDALIIEHSAYADLLIYSNSNGIITKDLLNEASALIRQTPMVTAARLHAIQLYSNPSFIEAGIADPTFVDKGGSDYLERDWMRRSSFERLMSESKYDDIKLMLGLNLHDSLSVQFKLMNADKQKLFLHYAWTIVAHMQIGNGPEYFGGSLIRLKESLKL